MSYPAREMRDCVESPPAPQRGAGLILLCLLLSSCVVGDYPYFVKGSKIDVVFVLDNTATMAARIGAIKDSIIGYGAGLARQAIQPAFGVVSFGDTPSEQSALTAPSTAEEMAAWLQDLAGVDGHDDPENPLDSIRYACDAFQWRPGARRCIVVITDVWCHQAGDGSGLTAQTVDGLAASLRGSVTVYAVSPVLLGDLSPYGDVRWLADGYGAGPGVTASTYGAVRRSEGTGGAWTRLSDSGTIDLDDIGLAEGP
jgi:hypothetical protein